MELRRSAIALCKTHNAGPCRTLPAVDPATTAGAIVHDHHVVRSEPNQSLHNAEYTAFDRRDHLLAWLYTVAAWLRQADGSGALSAFLHPGL
jgi:hypothetical protein